MICHHHGDEEPGGADERPVTCGRTQILLPTEARRHHPRHRKRIAAKANGAGHRTIAANLDRWHQTR